MRPAAPAVSPVTAPFHFSGDRMYKRLMLGLIAGSAVIAAAACSSGGGNVTGNNPLNPTTAPSGFVASPSPTPAGGTTTTAPTSSPLPTLSAALPVATPTATSVSSTAPVSTPTATSVASTGPAPTPTATTGGTTAACATSSAAVASMNYSLSGAAITINLPSYPSTGTAIYTGTSNIPTNSGTTLTVKLDSNNFDNVTPPSGQTVDLYTSIELSSSTTFGDGSQNLRIPVTINSGCIVTTRTYHVYEFAFGSTVYPNTSNANGAAQNIMPTVNGTANGFIVDTTNPFPGSVPADIIITHATGT